MMSALPRFDFRVRFASVTDVGRIRTNNEDVARVEPSLGLFLVADGMGGHAAGEVAAQITADAVADSIRGKDAQRAFDRYVAGPTLEARHRVLSALRHAAEAANTAVLKAAEENLERRGMGCTLDAVVLLRDRAFVAHVGDSRVYLARASTTIHLTQDHSLHEQLLAEGGGKAGPARGQNPLVNAIGLSPKLTVDGMLVDLSRGDRLILCTDGVHGPIASEAEFAQIARSGTPREAARCLIDTAMVRGGRDNCTAVVIDIAERFVTRTGGDGGLMARDLATVRACPLLADLPSATAMRALAAAVEVEIAGGTTLPRTVANDQVAYILLDGEVEQGGRAFGSAALVYPESLMGEFNRAGLFKATRAVRALRLRSDDFKEVCDSDVALAAALYERIARHLARR